MLYSVMSPRGAMGHVHPSFPRGRFYNLPKSVEKPLRRGEGLSDRLLVSFLQNAPVTINAA